MNEFIQNRDFVLVSSDKFSVSPLLLHIANLINIYFSHTDCLIMRNILLTRKMRISFKTTDMHSYISHKT